MTTLVVSLLAFAAFLCSSTLSDALTAEELASNTTMLRFYGISKQDGNHETFT